MAGGQAEGISNAFVTRVARTVNSAMNGGRLFADIFHDVDLAAGGPARLVDVIAEHPECGPDSLTARDLDAGLETAVVLRELALGFEAGGGVVARHAVWAGVFFLNGFDDQVAIMQRGVLGADGVVLEFVIAPAAASGFQNPLGRIRSGAIGAIKFVAPHQSPRGCTWPIIGGLRFREAGCEQEE